MGQGKLGFAVWPGGGACLHSACAVRVAAAAAACRRKWPPTFITRIGRMRPLSWAA